MKQGGEKLNIGDSRCISTLRYYEVIENVPLILFFSSGELGFQKHFYSSRYLCIGNLS